SPEKPPFLQFRNNFIHEKGEVTRKNRRQNIKAIRGTLLKPTFKLVSDFSCSTNHTPMSTSTGNPFIQLSDGEIMLAGNLNHEVLSTDKTLGFRQFWQWLIQREL